MFADEYRRLVVPDLEAMCRVQGLLLAQDRITFTEAWAAVWWLARRRGAAHLSYRHVIKLDEWIGARLICHEGQFRPSVLERRAIADKVARDLEPWCGR